MRRPAPSRGGRLATRAGTAPPSPAPAPGVVGPVAPDAHGEAAPTPDPAGEAPRALRPFLSFPTVLRRAGFAIAPEQMEGFVAAVGLLGPRGIGDVHAAARALLAPPPERRDAFDALFRAHFLGQSLAAAAPEGDEEEIEAFNAAQGDAPPPEAREAEESGAAATGAEALRARRLDPAGEEEALRRLARLAPDRLPRRLSRRRRTARRGEPDLRRARRRGATASSWPCPGGGGGSGSGGCSCCSTCRARWKAQSEGAPRFAHALTRAGERVETFTLGTRLTRITRACAPRDSGRAVAAASALVADWDGGTRLGDALAAFIAVPRFAGLARGALVLVVSDGLERGSPGAMVSAVRRLSRLAWSLH